MDLGLTYSRAQNDIFFPTQKQGFPKFTHVRKGRRLGLTRGAAQAFIEYGLSVHGDPGFWFLPPGKLYFMWGDTVNTNIKKYIERYFMPILMKIPKPYWHHDRTNKVLYIGRAVIDFRSADNPENWEGFGYHVIFLNEAGIILEDDYLYENAVLPMLMDYPEARLIAAGVPKGKRTAEGVHKFYDIYLKALKDKINYRLLRYNSYQNPFIGKEQVDLIASVMDEYVKQQEIDGEFIDIAEKAFFYIFRENIHVIPSYKPNRALPLLISFDFNKDPCTATIGQKPTFKSLRIFDEIAISRGSTPEVCEEILAKYPEFQGNWDVTGDATGQNQTAMIKGNVTHYTIIKDMLNLSDDNLHIGTVNPSLLNSRVFTNACWNKLDVRITANCEKTINDCIFTTVDEYGKVVKKENEGRHFFDNVRYTLHDAFPDFLDNPALYL